MNQMNQHCKPMPRRKDYRQYCMYAVWFGLGLSLSTFCPVGLTFFIIGIILVAMGIMVMRC